MHRRSWEKYLLFVAIVICSFSEGLRQVLFGLPIVHLGNVIFICLFVVIIGYAQVAAAADRQREEEVAALEEKVALLEAESFDQEAAMKAYEDAAAAYEGTVIGSRVMIVTVSCTYSSHDALTRQIRIMTSDKEFDPIQIRTGSEKTGFSRLSRLLEDYILSHKDQVVVLSLNTDSILVRDKEAASGVLEDLAEKYDYVY